MSENLTTTRVHGLTATWRLTDGGELVAFGIEIEQAGIRKEAVLSMRYEMLAPFITRLLALGQTAEAVRAKDPLLRTTTGAYVTTLEGASIAPTVTRPGWHLLRIDVSAAAGSTSYTLRADKPHLQRLRDALDAYLKEAPDTPRSPATH